MFIALYPKKDNIAQGKKNTNKKEKSLLLLIDDCCVSFFCMLALVIRGSLYLISTILTWNYFAYSAKFLTWILDIP